MTRVHLAWFRREDGQWLGEWAGQVPSPPPQVLASAGEQRIIGMNTWLHDTQMLITPSGSAYMCESEVWDMTAWDECPDGGAVCAETSRFKWPVGDHRYHQWDALNNGLDWPKDQHYFIEVNHASRMITSNQSGSRPIVSPQTATVLDITGTPLRELHGQVFGTLSECNGRLLIDPSPMQTHLAEPLQRALDLTVIATKALGDTIQQRVLESGQ